MWSGLHSSSCQRFKSDTAIKQRCVAQVREWMQENSCSLKNAYINCDGSHIRSLRNSKRSWTRRPAIFCQQPQWGGWPEFLWSWLALLAGQWSKVQNQAFAIAIPVPWPKSNWKSVVWAQEEVHKRRPRTLPDLERLWIEEWSKIPSSVF